VAITNSRGFPHHLNGRCVEVGIGFLPLPLGIHVGIVIQSYNNTVTQYHGGATGRSQCGGIFILGHRGV